MTELADSSDTLVRRTVLPGGLRVITESLPTVRSASFGIWAGVGSRDEDPPHAGATHYLEHLLFKGTKRRTALDISASIDAVGGELNAFTAKEYTCYYARVLDDDLPLAIDVLCDMVTSSVLDPTEIDAERAVILEEIAMTEDDSSDAAHEAFSWQLFGDTPLGRPILGTVDSIESISREQIAEHYAARYTPDNLVIAAAGRLDHDEVVEITARFRCRARPGVGSGPGQVARPGWTRGRFWYRRATDFPPDRAGQPGPGLCRPGENRRAQVHPRGTERRARRRHVVAAVPGDQGKARPRLLGIQLQLTAR
jgi:secreted Zn-dependent insulinase-like peptidase